MRTDWFTNARFGMFIHWGIYAVPGRGEWTYANDVWLPGEYEALAKKFDPVNFDPEEWANLAKNAGMKYVVFTTKHHDGFCMFDSHYTDYKVTNTPYGKDVTGMLVEAFRTAGLKIGFYHSLPDWTHPGYADWESPEGYHKKELHTPTAEEYRDFLDYLYNNVEQLMTEYGKIDLLFFDYTSKYKDNTDYFDRNRLLKMIYKHQPEIIVNDRLSFSKENVCDFDYYTPEITVMNQAPTVKGRPVIWESCATMNSSWGYNKNDNAYKDVAAICGGLFGCVSQNGNLLLNAGPQPDGRLTCQTVKILQELAQWFKVNGEAITGCGKSEYTPPYGLYYTQKEKTVYAYVAIPPMGDIILPQLNGKATSVTLLRDNSNAEFITHWGYELLRQDEIRIRHNKLQRNDVLKIEIK